MGRRLRDDDGVTLVEMVVAMGVMLIFLGIFTGAMVMMSKSETKARSVSDTSTQLNVAFLWFDRNVRYASALTAPGASGGNFYVELSNTGSGNQVCTQVRLNTATDKLERRSWTVTGTSPAYANLTGWLRIASNITNTTTPFSVASQATGSEVHQQLGVNLTSTGGPGNALTTSQSSFTLTAVNSPAPGTVSGVCQEVARSVP